MPWPSQTQGPGPCLRKGEGGGRNGPEPIQVTHPPTPPLHPPQPPEEGDGPQAPDDKGRTCTDTTKLQNKTNQKNNNSTMGA